MSALVATAWCAAIGHADDDDIVNDLLADAIDALFIACIWHMFPTALVQKTTITIFASSPAMSKLPVFVDFLVVSLILQIRPCLVHCGSATVYVLVQITMHP
jgi:hypothetical protein